MAKLLFQVPHDGSWALPRARPVHSVDEAQEHPSSSSRRRDDYPPWFGVLRLTGPGDRAIGRSFFRFADCTITPGFYCVPLRYDLHLTITCAGSRTFDIHLSLKSCGRPCWRFALPFPSQLSPPKACFKGGSLRERSTKQ